MPKLLTSCLEVVAFASIIAGTAMVWTPLAFIAGGVGLLIVSWRNT